ncbi:MAG: hypothetical protein Kow0025_26310 [Thermodesulfovibrionales bacterium]
MEMDQVPFEKLRLFLEKLSLSQDELERLEPYRAAFTARSREFAEYFYSVFYEIPGTRMMLRHEQRPGFLKRAWANWFEGFFRARLEKEFLAYLWRVGMRHVEVNLDQRFSNLGFSVLRHYCHRIALAEVAPADQLGVIQSIDKLVDLCLLVETSAYIEGTTHCDIEIINAIADKIRNPVTIIGGNIKRLQHKLEKSDPLYETYEYIVDQSEKCARMVEDVKTYNEIFRAEASFEKVGVDELVDAALGKLLPAEEFEGDVERSIEPGAALLKGDRRQLGLLFLYLLENAVEAAAASDAPLIRISASEGGAPPHSVLVEIFNTGAPPAELSVDKLAAPFYSTKARGSGFGLTIARLVVRKHFGGLTLESRPGGTSVIVTLPVWEGGASPS